MNATNMNWRTMQEVAWTPLQQVDFSYQATELNALPEPSPCAITYSFQPAPPAEQRPWRFTELESPLSDF